MLDIEANEMVVEYLGEKVSSFQIHTHKNTSLLLTNAAKL